MINPPSLARFLAIFISTSETRDDDSLVSRARPACLRMPAIHHRSLPAATVAFTQPASGLFAFDIPFSALTSKTGRMSHLLPR